MPRKGLSAVRKTRPAQFSEEKVLGLMCTTMHINFYSFFLTSYLLLRLINLFITVSKNKNDNYKNYKKLTLSVNNIHSTKLNIDLFQVY